MRAPAELLRPFRPRAARWVALILCTLIVLGAPTLVVIMAVNDLPMTPADAIGTVVVAVVLAWLCYRQAAVRAVPDDEGLTVHNFIRVRRLAWEQIVSVRFGPNQPWAQLDLADGTSLATMAVQSADGEHGRREASRLATLVALHESGSQR